MPNEAPVSPLFPQAGPKSTWASGARESHTALQLCLGCILPDAGGRLRTPSRCQSWGQGQCLEAERSWGSLRCRAHTPWPRADAGPGLSSERQRSTDESTGECFGAMDNTGERISRCEPAPDQPRQGWGEVGEGVSPDPSSAPDLWNDLRQLLSSRCLCKTGLNAPLFPPCLFRL